MNIVFTEHCHVLYDGLVHLSSYKDKSSTHTLSNSLPPINDFKLHISQQTFMCSLFYSLSICLFENRMSYFQTLSPTNNQTLQYFPNIIVVLTSQNFIFNAVQKNNATFKPFPSNERSSSSYFPNKPSPADFSTFSLSFCVKVLF